MDSPSSVTVKTPLNQYLSITKTNFQSNFLSLSQTQPLTLLFTR